MYYTYKCSIYIYTYTYDRNDYMYHKHMLHIYIYILELGTYVYLNYFYYILLSKHVMWHHFFRWVIPGGGQPTEFDAGASSLHCNSLPRCHPSGVLEETSHATHRTWSDFFHGLRLKNVWRQKRGFGFTWIGLAVTWLAWLVYPQLWPWPFEAGKWGWTSGFTRTAFSTSDLNEIP